MENTQHLQGVSGRVYLDCSQYRTFVISPKGNLELELSLDGVNTGSSDNIIIAGFGLGNVMVTWINWPPWTKGTPAPGMPPQLSTGIDVLAIVGLQTPEPEARVMGIDVKSFEPFRKAIP